ASTQEQPQVVQDGGDEQRIPKDIAVVVQARKGRGGKGRWSYILRAVKKKGGDRIGEDANDEDDHRQRIDPGEPAIDLRARRSPVNPLGVRLPFFRRSPLTQVARSKLAQRFGIALRGAQAE